MHWIGPSLRALRQQTGTTAMQVAEAAGLSRSAISHIEASAKLRESTVTKYLRALERADRVNAQRRPLLARTLIQAGLDILNEIHAGEHE